MKFPSLTTAAGYLGAPVPALVTQCRRLERDIGETLFTRSAFGSAQQPTARGQALLDDLALDRVQQLMRAALRDELGPPMPADSVLASANLRCSSRRAPGPLTPFDDIPVERIRIHAATLTFLRDLLDQQAEEIYGAQIRFRTGLDAGTLYPGLRRLEQAGWLTSRPEDDQSWRGRATVGRGPGRRRIYYAFTAEGRRAATREVERRSGPSPEKATPR